MLARSVSRVARTADDRAAGESLRQIALALMECPFLTVHERSQLRTLCSKPPLQAASATSAKNIIARLTRP